MPILEETPFITFFVFNASFVRKLWQAHLSPEMGHQDWPPIRELHSKLCKRNCPFIVMFNIIHCDYQG